MSAVMDDDPNRALHAALLGSLALHAVVFFTLPVRTTVDVPPAPPEPILAYLREPPEVPKPPPALARKAEPPVVKPPPAVERKPKTRPKPSAKKPLPSIAEPQAAPPTEPPVAVAPQPAPRLEMPNKVETPPPAAPAPRADVAEPRDELIVADYRAQLLSAARKFKRYPPVARDNGWEGEAVVKIIMGTGAAEAELALAASSGHAVLDRQALEMFRRALRLVPVPAQLQGKPFSVELRAVYRLNDQGSG